MKLIFSPTARYADLSLEKVGDALVINGEIFDFSALEAGDELPADAVSSEFIRRPVIRDMSGEIVIPIRLPCATDAGEARRFPEPIIVQDDGPIVLPE